MTNSTPSPSRGFLLHGNNPPFFNFSLLSFQHVEDRSGSLGRNGGFRFAAHERPVHLRRDGDAVALNADSNNTPSRLDDCRRRRLPVGGCQLV